MDAELSNDDWDVMVLHYLGVDHIGHLAGPRSPLLPVKLREMDTIIERIYNALDAADKVCISFFFCKLEHMALNVSK